jgi:molybdopterin converting factor small subunit
MAILVHIPGYLREWTEGRSQVKLDGNPATAGEVLALLCASYPGVRDRVMDERGEVRLHVNVFVGDESIRFTGGLATALEDATEVSIVPAVSGG